MSDSADRNFRWQTLVRIVSVALLVFAAATYARNLVPRWRPVPLAPLVVSPELEKADSLSTTPGALRGYDVILVTLDTTRPDRLGCYGNADIQTPNLDRLAREGVIFSRAIATGPTTLPTHASILTGLYPQHHGVRANSFYRLNEDQRTLAEVLSRAGYATGAFVSAFVLDDRFGLDQGFDVYDSQVASPSHVMGYVERTADDTTDQALGWLRRRQAEPYFLWVHYYDPHANTNPPSPFKEQHDLAYDGEIAFVDHELGRLLEAVRASGRKTLVVVVGDHGEALGEHGEWTHGHLLQEATLQIPLILHAPGGLPRGLHVDARVSQVDLLPTILTLLGASVPDDLDGVSLTRAAGADRELLAETMEGRAQYGWARLSAVYQGALKYIHGPAPELYDLARDPLERDDVVAARAEDASALRRLLGEREEPTADRLGDANVELAAEDIRRLEALGYAVGDGTPSSSEGGGADPKRMLPLIRELDSLTLAYEHPALSPFSKLLWRLAGMPVIEGRSELVRELERLASDHPDFAPVYQYLETFYREEDRLEDAASAKQRWMALRGRDS
jgi:arylsulfatase A-like enzyme